MLKLESRRGVRERGGRTLGGRRKSKCKGYEVGKQMGQPVVELSVEIRGRKGQTHQSDCYMRGKIHKIAISTLCI